ncbi:hypothetical protein WA026_003253 [Henosepilachna vigintioctopunctata]|uniref:Uncharacterized protein n=1 Tax=Henosepilachna vigintioctopunctata TaxID=420089 RepID=A0AAW1TIQ0_9CUCU
MKAFCCLIFLCGITTITSADPALVVNGVKVNDEQLQMQWNSLKLGEGEILTATVNDYTDKLLENLGKMMIKEGADPLSLPDVEQQIRKKILFIHYKGSLKFTYLSVSGLSSLSRSGDSSITYDMRSKKVRFDIPLKLNEIDVTCQFKAKLPPFSSHGRLTGEMKDVNMITSIEIDLNQMKASLLEYKITNSGTIKVHFHVGKIINWLMNLIGDAATGIFKSKINKEIDNVVTEAMQKVVDLVNQIISVSADSSRIQ